MNINSLIMYLLMGLIVINNFFIKLLMVFLSIALLIKNKFVKQSAKEVITNLVYFASVVSLNYFININLNIVNFAYLVLLSCALFISKKKFKNESFLSFYFLLVVFIGGAQLWKNF